MKLKKLNRKQLHINYLKPLAVITVMFWIASCAEPDRPYSPEMKHDKKGVQFTADVDMYHSPSFETYAENPNFANNMASRLPVKGTIPRGFMPYTYPNTNEGYMMAGDSLKNPIPLTPEVMAEGQEIYSKFCVHCHGKEGNGDGTIIVNTDGKFPPPPSYSTGISSGGGDMKDLPEGRMYHTIMYGKNMMGSHASQLNEQERWKVIHYVQTLQKAGSETSSDDNDAEANGEAAEDQSNE